MKKSISILLFVLAFVMNARAESTVLWSGSQDLGTNWTSYVQLTENVSTLTASQKVTIEYTTNSSATYSSLVVTAGWTDKLFNPAITLGTTTYIDYLSKADIKNIAKNSNTIIVKGYNITITKISVSEFEPTLLDDASLDVNWNTPYSIPSGLLEDLQVGDKINVTLSSATYVSGSKWPTLRLDYKYDETTTDNNGTTSTSTKQAELKKYQIYDSNGAFTCPYTVTYTVTEDDLAKIQNKGFLGLNGSSITISKIEFIKYVVSETTKEIEIISVLFEGSQAIGWSQLCSQPTSVINSLKEGDVFTLNVTPSAENTDQQLYIRYASSSNIAAWNGASNFTSGVVSHTLTTDDVTNIQTNKKLYISGCNLTVTKWTLTTKKTVSIERGNASTTLWEGSQEINWNVNGNNVAIESSKFTDAVAGQKVRMNFSGLKMSAQGNIYHNWTAFDGISATQLSTCGDYFEYTLTEDMVTNLKADGLRVIGVGYTLTSVELIDPMKEYVIAASFDTNDIKAWEPTEETPNLTVTLTNYEESEVKTTVTATLITDTYEDFKTYTSEEITLASNQTKSVDLQFTDLEPGFYRMTAKANNNTVCTYYIGYNPTAIGCKNDAQPDFWTFWDKEKRKLAKIDIDATLTELTDKSTTNRKVYEVKMQSVPDVEGESTVYIYGYYAEPKEAGTYPCLVRFQGTDSGSGTPKAMGGDDNPGWCELIISTRGQMLSRVKDDAEFKKFIPAGKTAADFYAYGLGDNDKHYYRAAYLDCKRAIDFVASREKVNKDKIFAAGGSQGGCFTYVAAALDDRIRAIAPSITGHADFPHTMEIVSWPTSIFNNWITAHTGEGDGNYATAEDAKAALLKHLSYFDTKNFASRITCPVITNFSLQDQTDGPHLNISPYNLLVNVASEDKSYSINPFKGHAAADNWETTFKEFFNKYMDTPATKSYFLSVGETGYSTVYLPFDALVPNGVEVYTVSSISGNKVQLTGHTAESGNQLLLPKTTAVVVNAAKGDYQFVANSAEMTTTSVSGTNLLNGVTERTAVSSLNSNCTVYALGSGNDNIAGFYKVNSDSYIPANKAYLSVATSSPQSLSRAFYISSPTGITNVGNADQNVDTPAYSINGIKLVNGNKSGILVKKGKKIINK